MNAFWKKAIPFIARIAAGKPAAITLGDAPPSEGEIIADGAVALAGDLVTKPPEYPNFEVPTTHGEPRA